MPRAAAIAQRGARAHAGRPGAGLYGDAPEPPFITRCTEGAAAKLRALSLSLSRVDYFSLPDTENVLDAEFYERERNLRRRASR